MRRGWIERREGELFRLSRRHMVRWDVAARTTLPNVGRRRLAHAVRQDMWRLLKDVRGFEPVVEVTRTLAGCSVRAGGAVSGGTVPGSDAGLSARVQAMLEDRAFREAWVRAARHRSIA